MDVRSPSLVDILASPREDRSEKSPCGNGTIYLNPVPFLKRLGNLAEMELLVAAELGS